MVRTISALGSLALLCSAAAGKEINRLGKGFNAAYDSGAVHEQIMQKKMAGWDAELASGAMNSALYPELGYTKCVNGFAEAIVGDKNNTFKCRNADLYHFLSHAATGSKVQGQASSSWGWTSSTGREFVAIGQLDGTAFVEVSKEGKMIYLGRLESGDGIGARWREIRTVGDHIVVGSEAFDHGIQFFDMKKLLTLDPASPKTFTNADLASHWGRVSQGNPADAWDKLPVGRTHNVVVNEELKWAAAVGSVAGNITTRVRDFSKMPCNGGIIFFNTTDLNNVKATGCASADHYVHDAQCVVYRGPDTRYYGRDICYGYNEDTITIFDVTNKIGNNTKIISRISYEGAEYIHQGFVLDLQNQEYLIMDDEYDEVEAVTGPASVNKLPTTHIFDIRDLENPKYAGNFQGKTRNIDHNQYVIDGFSYQSNYGAGLTVWDIRSIPKNPSGKDVKEVAFFDIYPEDDELPGGGSVAFLGSWSHYAYFKSGYVYINTIERGSFIVKLTAKTPAPAPVCNADNCLRAFRANTIPGRLAESQAFCSSFLARKRDATAVTKTYALQSCTRTTDVAAQVSSACACIPSAVVPL